MYALWPWQVVRIVIVNRCMYIRTYIRMYVALLLFVRVEKKERGMLLVHMYGIYQYMNMYTYCT